ncbi:MAG TPA: HAD family phosphatase [Phycisphaerae bacterium]|nr:HAD family phosphatase [Phycisphaerae bacterium]
MTEPRRTLTGLGVIFDIDGVLVDSYDAHLESWRRLAIEFGKPITEAQFAATFGMRSREIIHLLFGIDDDATLRRCDDRKEAIYRDLIRDAVPEMPGASNLVRRLFAAGAKIAVGSSGPPVNVDLVCSALKIDDLLAARVTGADVTHGKPDPEVFLLAARRMGIEPTKCVVIEDAPSGVEAAHRARMICVALRGQTSSSEIEQADLVIKTLNYLDGAAIASLLVGKPA